VRVYGSSEHGGKPKSETSECFPDDSYGRSKFAAEKALLKMNSNDFIVSIVRTPLVYGEGVKANMLNLIRLVDSVPILPFGKIANRRSFTYAENLVAFIDRIIEKRASGIFIAMDDNPLSTTEMVEIISKHLGKKTHLFKLPGIVSVMLSYLMPEKLDRLFGSSDFENKITKNTLNFSPPVTTDEGIRRTVEFFKVRKKSNNVLT
jgi:UDP-glucose 4-epimerase